MTPPHTYNAYDVEAMGPFSTIATPYNGAAVAPHSATSRISLSGVNRPRVAHVTCTAYRIAAASVAGRWGFILLSGTNVVKKVSAIGNAIGDQVQLDIEVSCPKGAAITLQTFDLSTGGTIDYDASMIFVTL